MSIESGMHFIFPCPLSSLALSLSPALWVFSSLARSLRQGSQIIELSASPFQQNIQVDFFRLTVLAKQQQLGVSWEGEDGHCGWSGVRRKASWKGDHWAEPWRTGRTGWSWRLRMDPRAENTMSIDAEAHACTGRPVLLSFRDGGLE